MRRARQIVLLASLAAAMLPMMARAAVPPILNFQGILLDSVGGTVPDGSYDLTFRIYNADVGGSLWWSETQTVATENGLFSTHLGSVNPVPDTVFKGPDRWLEMQLSGNPLPYAPRSKIGSVGYAYRVNSIDDATGGDIYGDVQVHSTVTIGNLNESTGGTLEVTNGTSSTINADGNSGQVNAKELELGSNGSTGRLDLFLLGTSTPILTATNKTTVGAALNLFDEAGVRTHILEADFGGAGGFFAVNRSGPSPAFTVDGNTGSGEPVVSITGSARSIVFDMGVSGNASVALPANAIDNTELLAEPGISSTNTSGSTVLNNTAMVDIQTVQITIPDSGYIVVEGKCYVELEGITSAHTVHVQIDETSGGIHTFPYSTRAGLGGYTSTAACLFPVYVTRVYRKGAGTHTFRMEGKRFEATAGAVSTAWHPILTATYYQTSYGTVETVVSATEAAGFESAVPVEAVPTADVANGGGTETMYKVDLRELELKAAKARIEAERLERELLEARLQEQLNAGSSPNRN